MEEGQRVQGSEELKGGRLERGREGRGRRGVSTVTGTLRTRRERSQETQRDKRDGEGRRRGSRDGARRWGVYRRGEGEEGGRGGPPGDGQTMVGPTVPLVTRRILRRYLG